MLKYFFLIFTVLFLIFSFSTAGGFAHPISTSTSGRKNLMLMGQAVHYSEHDIAMTPSESYKDSDEFSITRAQRFRHRLIQKQRMQGARNK